ncbi:hypothetical protein LSM04_001550 [Trypanosoma melophagium]|uniref:uncharacterized protein n=1 Tax=Trypanosoma melophagium TaxID=715481 RepID=UPI00351A9D7F|nr:hypothetical protein LSM04_001550 [Trypanosoma melophagium]
MKTKQAKLKEPLVQEEVSRYCSGFLPHQHLWSFFGLLLLKGRANGSLSSRPLGSGLLCTNSLFANLRGDLLRDSSLLLLLALTLGIAALLLCLRLGVGPECTLDDALLLHEECPHDAVPHLIVAQHTAVGA